MVAVTVADPGVYAWKSHGLCFGSADESLFFPIEGLTFNPDPAKNICNGDPDLGTLPCPVLDICREYAIAAREVGVWGGMSEKERRAELKRRQRRAADAARRQASFAPDDSESEDVQQQLRELALRQEAIEAAMAARPRSEAPVDLKPSSRTVDPQGPRLARLLEHLAARLIADDGTLDVKGDPFLQELAKAIGQPTWDDALGVFSILCKTDVDEYQLMFDKLVSQLARRRCSVTVKGEPALQLVAEAMGFSTWMEARVSSIEGLSRGGIVVYFRFSHELTVHCHLAQNRLDKEERERRMPNHMWRASIQLTLEPARVPPEYQHLVHEAPAYVRTQPFKDGAVSEKYVWEILRRIADAGGELEGVTVPQLREDLGVDSNSTISRILQNLDAAGLIQRDKLNDRVRPGTSFRLTGHGVVWLLTNRERYMQRFARQSA